MRSFTNNEKLSFDEMLAIEKEIYAAESGCDNVVQETCDLLEVKSRPMVEFRDKEYNLPQNIFLLKGFGDVVFVGRKLRSILHIENKINAINCSMITADMLLGVIERYGKSEKDVWLEYHPFKKSEKRGLFDKIKINNQIEIIYPFLYKKYETGLEKITPPEGWNIFPERVTYLGYGEEHIRKYSVDVLFSYLNKAGTKIFDPACSTGEFLYTLKRAYPQIITIGQDLSQAMVNYAKPYVDQIYCGDSISTPVEDGSVDVIVFRFLNSEIVSQEYAKELFNVLIKKMSDNGIAVLFGHTPVLLDLEYFTSSGCEVLQSSAYSKERDSIFQYYILRKKK